RDAALSANHKITAVLPDKLRQEVEYLENSIRFVALNGPFAPETLQQIRRAIIQRRTVRFRYYSRPRDLQPGETSQREADPYALVHIGSAWMLVAYCHLRHDKRHFRLDRMEEVVVLDKGFTRPTDFQIERRKENDRTITVKALFDHETARWAQESPSYFKVSQVEQAEGLLITLTISQPGDILNWLLGWGSHVRVLEPESLREILVREAEMTLKNHQK
ncbi:MAG: WYL domain-containing protein, partial [Chloroflexota bacterium]